LPPAFALRACPAYDPGSGDLYGEMTMTSHDEDVHASGMKRQAPYSTPAKAQPRARYAALTLIAFGVSTLLAVALLEVGGRIVTRRTEESMLVSPHLNWTKCHQYDPDLMWTLRPDLRDEPQSYPFVNRKPTWTVSTNGLGLRQAAVQPKGTRYRILCLGDSRTYGLGVNDDETWPLQLQAILEDQSPGVYDVVNAGVPGYTAFHGVTYLDVRGFELEPDMALVCFGYNEASEVPPPGLGDWDWENPNAHCGIVTLLIRAFRGAGLERETLASHRTTRLTPGEYLDSLLEIGRLCRAHGVVPVYLAWPALPEALGEQFDRLHYASLGAKAGQLVGAPSIDLTDFIRANAQAIFIDDVHFNARGNRLLAEYIAGELGAVFASGLIGPDARRPPGVPAPTYTPQEIAAAIEVYRTWIAADPGCFKPYVELDALLQKHSGLDERIQEWRATAAAHPDVARPRYLLGLALQAQGDLDGAIAAYRAAVEREPEDPAVHASLGLALARQGAHRDAVAAYRTTLRLSQDAHPIRLDLVKSLYALGEYDAAREEAQQCQERGVVVSDALLAKLSEALKQPE